MGTRRISDQLGLEAIHRDDQATAVRYLLQLAESQHPGGTIELRVPPFGAVQLIEGLNHRRGTPPNVVEMSPDTFLDLALGDTSFDEMVGQSKISLSGDRAKVVKTVFPVKLPE